MTDHPPSSPEPKGETRIAELALAAARDVVTDLRVNGASLCEKGAAEAEFIVWIATVLEQYFREPLAELYRLTTALAEAQEHITGMQATMDRWAEADHESCQRADAAEAELLTLRASQARLVALRQKFEDYRTFSGNEAVSPRPQTSRSYRAERQAEVGVFNVVLSELDAALSGPPETQAGGQEPRT